MPFHDQHPGVFLEVGVGANDFQTMPTPLVGLDFKVTSFDFTGTNRYIGIDKPTDEQRYWRGIHQFMLGGDADIDVHARAHPEDIIEEFEAVKEKVQEFRPYDNIDFVIADAEALPFADGSIAEVYMANVLGSQMRDENIEKILLEARRVIGDEGRLTIRENITPHWVPTEINDMVRGSGFINEMAKYMLGSAEYNALVEQYGLHPNDAETELNVLAGDNTFLVAEVKG